MNRYRQMFQRWPVAKMFLLLCALQVLLILPGYWWPGYLDSPIGLVFLLPFLIAYAAHALGMPGVLQHNGACGWGWCAPTLPGWMLAAAIWLLLTWGMARLLVSLFSRRRDQP